MDTKHYPPEAYVEKYVFRANKMAGEPCYEWPSDDHHALYVLMKDGHVKCYPDISASERHTGNVEGDGCLTIYRQWDTGVCSGRFAVASYASGIWQEWESK